MFWVGISIQLGFLAGSSSAFGGNQQCFGDKMDVFHELSSSGVYMQLFWRESVMFWAGISKQVRFLGGNQ